ncbi:MarR family winged helix-turn-helix transcriptional regulator [Ornithinimicrobium panacihumi]|uniref:MarR family winged helix-turn-helix transcriptional regulator n=1 Tax=Ornithinimicrobium panacihumi TaxID=2008449 RepID=UPI003F8C56E1
MQLSEGLARAFASMGRLVHDWQGDLTQGDYATLVRLSAAECTRSRDLAEAEGLDPSTMSRRLASLAERGFVDRHPDPADRRAQVIGLTDPGREAMLAERTRRLELITGALGDWTQEDRDELARLLSRLSESIEARRAGGEESR